MLFWILKKYICLHVCMFSISEHLVWMNEFPINCSAIFTGKQFNTLLYVNVSSNNNDIYQRHQNVDVVRSL